MNPTRMAGMILCMALVGCPGGPRLGDDEEPARSAADDNNPLRAAKVATFGSGRAITVGELTDAIARQNPYIRMRYTSLERKKEFLKNMVRLEVLAAEANKRGLQRDPEVVRRVKRVMVDRLMEQLHRDLVKFDAITDADARAYYDKNLQRYRHPAQVRASQIVVKTAGEAAKVLELLRHKPGNVRHFTELVATHSIDPASKIGRGNLDFFAADDKRLPAAVVKAAFGIAKMWDLAGPVKTAQGFVVLIKTGERPAVDRSFEAEKNRIKNRLFNERRFAAVNTFIEQLQTKSKIEVLEQNLARVKVEPPEKPAAPKAAGPGQGSGGEQPPQGAGRRKPTPLPPSHVH